MFSEAYLPNKNVLPFQIVVILHSHFSFSHSIYPFRFVISVSVLVNRLLIWT